MLHDANTFNFCDEVMSGWQDSFLLDLALQVVIRAPISHLLFAEDFRDKAFMKSVSN